MELKRRGKEFDEFAKKQGKQKGSLKASPVPKKNSKTVSQPASVFGGFPGVDELTFKPAARLAGLTSAFSSTAEK